MNNQIAEENGAVNHQQPKGFKKYASFFLELVKIAVIAFLIVLPIRYFLFQPFIVSGASMEPNFSSGDYLIVDEISYRFEGPKRGDVVIFNAGFIPNYGNERFIKRVVGLPGETINIKDGKVDITKDGQTFALDENYLPGDVKTLGDVNLELEVEQYFVLGDNRAYSYDSRMWGALPRDYIIGKAFFRVFPLASLSGIPQPAY